MFQNFNPADYFGCDGADPEDGSRWAYWIGGNEPLIQSEFALFLWWHLCDALDCIVTAGNPGVWPEEYWGELGQKPFEATVLKCCAEIQFIQSEIGQEVIQPFSFETHLENGHGKDNCVRIMATYSAWCVDQVIGAMLVGNAQKSATASAYALKYLELAHEYRKSSHAEIEAVIRSRMGSHSARLKLVNDPKQKEKALVKELWILWQQQPMRYKSKAAFSLDMLDKFQTLKSQRVIERWCKTWEPESF